MIIVPILCLLNNLFKERVAFFHWPGGIETKLAAKVRKHLYMDEKSRVYLVHVRNQLYNYENRQK